MEYNLGITGNLMDELVMPDMFAVIFATPVATAVTKPFEEMVAAAGLELVQVT